MCQSSVYVILACLLCEAVVVVAGLGTTPHLKEVFMGRCWQYQGLSEQNQIDSLKMDIDCIKLWDAFKEASAFKNPCNVNDTSYDNFFKLLDNPKKLTNALFWSGAHDLVTDFTFINDHYIVLEDTLTGYLMNNLIWCGSTTSQSGFNETYCEQNSRKCNSMFSAWKLASSKFADRAAGVTQTLLNASRSSGQPAYAKGSYFRTVEMPRLKVKKIIIYLASSVDKPIRERCATSASVKELQADASKRNIETECFDQPEFVLRVYCIKYPKSAKCNTEKEFLEDEPPVDNARLWKTVCLILIAVVAALLVYIAVCIAHKGLCFKKQHHLNHSYSWSFSKKPMLQNEQIPENNNDIERIV